MARTHTLIVALVLGYALLLIYQTNILGISQRNKARPAHERRLIAAQTLAEAHYRAAREVLVEEEQQAATVGEGASEDASEKFLFPLMKYGPNNQFICFMQCARVAQLTGRTLVLPNFQAWQVDVGSRAVWGFDEVFDAHELSRHVKTVSLSEYLRRSRGHMDMALVPVLPFMKYDSTRMLEGMQENNITTVASQLDSARLKEADVLRLFASNLSSSRFVAAAFFPHIKSILWPTTVPQCAIYDDLPLLGHMRFAPYVRRLAAEVLALVRRRALRASSGAGGAAAAATAPGGRAMPVLAVHVRRKGKVLRFDETRNLGKEDDSVMGKEASKTAGHKDGLNAKGKVALFNFHDKDIYFSVAEVCEALRQYVANHSIGAVYLATNRLDDVPYYVGNGTGAPIFSLSSSELMRQAIDDDLRALRSSSEAATELGGGEAHDEMAALVARLGWDNFLISMVEQEVAYQSEHFLGSVRSTWSDNVMWWRSAHRDKAGATGGVVQAVYSSKGWEWKGQIHDERVLAREEVGGGLVHKGWKEKRDKMVQAHNRKFRAERDANKRRAHGGDGDGEAAEHEEEDQEPAEAACVDNDQAAAAAAKSFGLEVASCAAGEKLGLCVEPAAKQVCPKSCGEC